MNEQFKWKERIKCFVPDSPVTRGEKLDVGLTGGTFRGVWREATANIEEEHFKVFVENDRGRKIEVNSIPIDEICKIGFEKITLERQIKAAFFRSLLIGLGFGFAIIVGIFIKAGASAPVFAIGFGLLGGEVLGLLFSFIPSLIKMKRNLWHLQLFNKDGVAPLIAVDTLGKIEAQKILSNSGIS